MIVPPAGAGIASGQAEPAFRLVILSRPTPIQFYTTNRVAQLVPVEAVVSETGRPFGERQSRRMSVLMKKRGLWGMLDRYLDLAYFKLQDRLRRPAETVHRMLGENGLTRGWARGLTVHEVEHINSPEAIALLRRLAPDVIFCNGASILKRGVIETARLAIINIHTGIAPRYRGASPEFWALYHDDPSAMGVTVHCLTEELDGGDILLQQTVQAEPGDDEIALRCRNVRVGAELVAEAARQIAAGTAKPIRQDPAAARTFPVRTRREDRELRRRLRERGPAAG